MADQSGAYAQPSLSTNGDSSTSHGPSHSHPTPLKPSSIRDVHLVRGLAAEHQDRAHRKPDKAQGLCDRLAKPT